MTTVPFSNAGGGARAISPFQQMMSLEQMMRQMGLLSADAAQESAAQEHALTHKKAVAFAAARLADSPDFQMLLEYLCDQTVRKPVHGLYNIPNPDVYAAERGGENKIIIHIFELIAQGRDWQTPTL